ncbi:MAG: T9SS type A sorting domain-containing protein, partial [Bacteroidales bacterium]
IVEGAESTFCWGSCFPPNVDTSGVTLVEAGASTGRGYFTGDYYGAGHPGTSVVMYKFYNVEDISQYLEVVVKYVAEPNAISENILRGVQFSAIYPNPAYNYVNLDFTLVPEVKTASIRISNLLGAVVSETNLNVSSNNARINVDQLVGGVYFYSVFVNGDRLNTKKLVIR